MRLATGALNSAGCFPFVVFVAVASRPESELFLVASAAADCTITIYLDDSVALVGSQYEDLEHKSYRRRYSYVEVTSTSHRSDEKYASI